MLLFAGCLAWDGLVNAVGFVGCLPSGDCGNEESLGRGAVVVQFVVCCRGV